MFWCVDCSRSHFLFHIKENGLGFAVVVDIYCTVSGVGGNLQSCRYIYSTEECKEIIEKNCQNFYRYECFFVSIFCIRKLSNFQMCWRFTNYKMTPHLLALTMQSRMLSICFNFLARSLHRAKRRFVWWSRLGHTGTGTKSAFGSVFLQSF